VKLVRRTVITWLAVWAGRRLLERLRRRRNDRQLPRGGDGYQVEPPVAGPAS
jgi:hypothetical protein